MKRESFIILKGILLKQIRPTFLKGESLTLRNAFSFAGTRDYYGCHIIFTI